MEFILLGLCDNTGPVLDTDALTVCLIFSILSVKKEANSLQALTDKNSDFTGTGGFVSLSTVANKVRELLLFLAIMSVKKDSLAFLSSKL